MWRTDAFIQGVDPARRAQWNGIPLCLGSYTVYNANPYYHTYTVYQNVVV